MTKFVAPQTFAGAMDEAISLLGADYAAAAASRSTTTIYNWRDPDRNDLPNGDQMAAVDAACLDSGRCTEGPFFRHMRRLHERAATRAPERVPVDLHDLASDMIREFGEHLVASGSLPRTGPLTATQCDYATKEAMDLMKLVQGYIDDVQARRTEIREVPA